jgi:hypothetical protein
MRTPFTLAIPFVLTALACSQGDGGGSSGDGAQAVSAAADVTVGEYDRNDGHLSGSIMVTSKTASSVALTLSIAQNHLPHNNGHLEVTASGADRHFVYKEAGCTITFDFAVDGQKLDVQQSDGACDGMGAGVTAQGTYKLAGADPGKLAPGEYDTLEIAVDGDVVTGMLHDSVGDPTRGGATCEFTLAGRLGADQKSTDVTVSNGFETIKGKLLVPDSLHVALQLPSLPVACTRVVLESDFSKAGGNAFKWSGLLDPTITGYRTVNADKAYFHDEAGGPARKAYILKGQTIQVLEKSTAEWINARFTKSSTEAETLGFVAGEDLVPLQ